MGFQIHLGCENPLFDCLLTTILGEHQNTEVYSSFIISGRLIGRGISSYSKCCHVIVGAYVYVLVVSKNCLIMFFYTTVALFEF